MLMARFLRDELAPYPGRVRIVARMVVAATAVAVLCMIFRIPVAYQGAIYALLVSHDAPQDNWRSAFRVVGGTVVATVYILVGACLFAGSPPLHFLWNLTSFFLAFFCVSAMREYAAAVPVAVVIGTAAVFWGRPLPVGANVADTLWLCLSSTAAAIVTAAVSSLFGIFQRHDPIVDPLCDRLRMVEETLRSCAAGLRATEELVEQLGDAVVAGTSGWRLRLRRTGLYRVDRDRLAAAGALIGRLVDIAASLPAVSLSLSANDRLMAARLAEVIAEFRAGLAGEREFNLPGLEILPGETFPIREVAETLELIVSAWTWPRDQSDSQLAPPSFQWNVFAPDAFVNSEHLKFALRGCLASTLCYVTYNAVAWQGLSSSIPTCMFTALSTVGASRQKQIVRLAGAILGGAIGMGAQIHIFPALDSIQGFAIVFAAVSAVAAWFMTCSPRLSYLGLQIAVTFDLIHLQGFRSETSLATARDRVVGISLGLIAMGLAFDYLWSSDAGVLMKRSFVRSLRLLARFVRDPVAKESPLRETIHAALDQTRSFSDGVLFEFGPARAAALEFREHVRRWQPQLRILFVMRISALGFELPPEALKTQTLLDDCSAGTLEDLADEIETGKDRNASAPECLIAFQPTISDSPHFVLRRAMVRQITTLARQIDVAFGK
jgi:multidrug resistance protein MdtO